MTLTDAATRQQTETSRAKVTSFLVFISVLLLLELASDYEAIRERWSESSEANFLPELNVPWRSYRRERVEINPNSTLADDILSIEHSSDEAAIYVKIRSDGRCAHPHLRARLSGPALAVVEWDTTVDGNTTNIMRGTYSVPSTGSYYFEIIAVFCYDFLRNAGVEPWENNFDFTQICAENPFHHQLTQDGAAIHVTRASPLVGHWIQNQSYQRPLYTRFQPPGCYDQKMRHTEKCNPPSASVTPFQNYTLELSFDIDMKRFRLEQQTSICLLGASHTRKMYEFLLNESGLNGTKLEFVYADVRMPFQVTVNLIRQLVETRGCHKFVLAVGQWPAGKRFRINEGRATQFGEYYREMKNVLSAIHESLPEVQVYARSINYNPLGALIVGCPASDWRSPIVIDGYNAVIEQVVSELGSKNITYLDTNFLVGPMWDSADDWCHLSEKVGTLHALYVVAVVIGLADAALHSIA